MEDVHMKNSPKRLLATALAIIALALIVAPVSFAGEDDPGPTQVGETQTAQPESLASQQGPVTASSGSKSSSTSSTVRVLGASRTAATTRTKDTVRAQGGIQAGFGGMATEGTSPFVALIGAMGIVLVLGAALIFVPARLRSNN